MPSPSTQFAVSVHPGELHFNAAHFITFNGTCENLHGHNFHVRIEATGNNTADAFVIDFVQLNQLAAGICSTLNDKVLLPTKNEEITLLHDGEQIEIQCHGRRFSLPADSCILLPIANTTAEMLAWYIMESLVPLLDKCAALSNLKQLQVAVEEADQQWGICKQTLVQRMNSDE